MNSLEVWSTINAYRYLVLPELYRKYADKDMQYALWTNNYHYFGYQHYQFIMNHIDTERIKQDYPKEIAATLIDELFEYIVSLYDDVYNKFEE